MNNQTAFTIIAILMAVVVADALFNEWLLTLATARLLVRFSDWLAFWRKF